MDSTRQQLSPEMLSRFHQLKNLEPMQLDILASTLQIHSALPGTKILQRGDSSGYALYLLKGKLRLSSTDGRLTEISAGSPQALNPIAHLLPRRYDVIALTPIEYLMLDIQLLEGLLSDQGDAFTATEIMPEEMPDRDTPANQQLMQTLLEDLEHDRLVLPSLPDIAIRVGREMNRENSDARKLANIIQTDPVITAKLIRAANSPLYGGTSPIDTCSAAVIRLGTNTTHNLVLTFALRELFLTDSPLLKTYMQQLWEHSIKISALCYVLAKMIGGFEPEHALLAGLLHDIGEVAILNYATRFSEVLSEQATLNQVIKELRSDIGSSILSNWGFMDDLVTAAAEAEHWHREHPGSADYADLVIIAQLHSYIGSAKMREHPPLNEVPAFNKLDIGELTPKMSLKILDRAEEKIQRAEALLRS